MAYVSSSDSFALDRLPVGHLGHQLAVFPLKLSFGICTVLSTCVPTFVPSETFVIVERQFLLFTRLLADFCASFDTDFKTFNEVKTSEVNMSTTLYPSQKIIQTVTNNGLSLTIKSHNFNTHLCQDKQNINTAKSLLDLIQSFLQLVLKAYCYPPLATKALTTCLEYIGLTEFKNLTEATLFKIFDTFPTNCVDYYHLSELVLRHKDLLYEMKRLQLFCNKKMAASTFGRPTTTSPSVLPGMY